MKIAPAKANPNVVAYKELAMGAVFRIWGDAGPDENIYVRLDDLASLNVSDNFIAELGLADVVVLLPDAVLYPDGPET